MGGMEAAAITERNEKVSPQLPPGSGRAIVQRHEPNEFEPCRRQCSIGRPPPCLRILLPPEPELPFPAEKACPPATFRLNPVETNGRPSGQPDLSWARLRTGLPRWRREFPSPPRVSERSRWRPL